MRWQHVSATQRGLGNEWAADITDRAARTQNMVQMLIVFQSEFQIRILFLSYNTKLQKNYSKLNLYSHKHESNYVVVYEAGIMAGLDFTRIQMPNYIFGEAMQPNESQLNKTTIISVELNILAGC